MRSRLGQSPHRFFGRANDERSSRAGVDAFMVPVPSLDGYIGWAAWCGLRQVRIRAKIRAKPDAAIERSRTNRSQR